MKDDPIINLATRFGPILKAAFPNEHSVTRFQVANALAEAALSAQQAAGEAEAVDHGRPTPPPPMPDEEFNPVRLGENVASMLKQKRLTCRAAAPEIGISPATLNRVSRGMMPDVPTYLKIMKWLGATTLYATPQPTETQRIVAWRPIETAPEGNGADGPFFDVTWLGEEHRYLPLPSRAIDCYRERGVVKCKHGFPSVTTIFNPQPTHWMPLPEAPASGDDSLIQQ